MRVPLASGYTLSLKCFSSCRADVTGTDKRCLFSLAFCGCLIPLTVPICVVLLWSVVLEDLSVFTQDHTAVNMFISALHVMCVLEK